MATPDFKPLGRDDLEGIATSAETFDPKRYPLGSLRALLADVALSALHYLGLAEKKVLNDRQNRQAQAKHRQSIRDEATQWKVPQSVIREARSRKVPVPQVILERSERARMKKGKSA